MKIRTIVTFITRTFLWWRHPHPKWSWRSTQSSQQNTTKIILCWNPVCGWALNVHELAVLVNENVEVELFKRLTQSDRQKFLLVSCKLTMVPRPVRAILIQLSLKTIDYHIKPLKMLINRKRVSRACPWTPYLFCRINSMFRVSFLHVAVKHRLQYIFSATKQL